MRWLHLIFYFSKFAVQIKKKQITIRILSVVKTFGEEAHGAFSRLLYPYVINEDRS